MIKSFFKRTILFSAIIPLDIAGYDKVSPDIKTSKAFELNKLKDTETGKDRLFMMFSTE